MKFQETKIQGGRGDKRRRCQEKDISRAGDVRKQRFHEQLVSRGKNVHRCQERKGQEKEMTEKGRPRKRSQRKENSRKGHVKRKLRWKEISREKHVKRKKWKEKNVPRKRDVDKGHTDDTIDEIQFLVWNDWALAVALQRGQGRRGTVLKKMGALHFLRAAFSHVLKTVFSKDACCCRHDISCLQSF